MDQVNTSLRQEGGCTPLLEPPPADDIGWAGLTGVNIKWFAVEENELDHTPDAVSIAVLGFAAERTQSEHPKGGRASEALPL